VAPPVRFPYAPDVQAPEAAALLPRLPLLLSYGERRIEVIGLLDTGATVNVLPFHIGNALGAGWESQWAPLELTGSLGRHEARALVVLASHPLLTSDTPVRLVFAWTRTDEVPVIFGQVNFFLSFGVCFHRADAAYTGALRTG
jgi:hypothetical protein